jgi:hypothetical protein
MPLPFFLCATLQRQQGDRAEGIVARLAGGYPLLNGVEVFTVPEGPNAIMYFVPELVCGWLRIESEMCSRLGWVEAGRFDWLNMEQSVGLVGR